jgi:hypothetical protein
MSGYVTLGLLFLTPATAIESAWVVSNTTEMERYVLGAGLAITVVAMMTRIKWVVLRFFLCLFDWKSILIFDLLMMIAFPSGDLHDDDRESFGGRL